MRFLFEAKTVDVITARIAHSRLCEGAGALSTLVRGLENQFLEAREKLSGLNEQEAAGKRQEVHSWLVQGIDQCSAEVGKLINQTKAANELLQWRLSAIKVQLNELKILTGKVFESEVALVHGPLMEVAKFTRSIYQRTIQLEQRSRTAIEAPIWKFVGASLVVAAAAGYVPFMLHLPIWAMIIGWVVSLLCLNMVAGWIHQRLGSWQTQRAINASAAPAERELLTSRTTPMLAHAGSSIAPMPAEQ